MLTSALPSLLVALVPLLGGGRPGPEPVATLDPRAPGDEPAPEQVEDPGLDYSFHAPLLNGFGLSELAELRGKPVLVEFWGTY